MDFSKNELGFEMDVREVMLKPKHLKTIDTKIVTAST